jgi:hypothetical protein
MFELRGGFCKKTEKTNYVILNLERKTNCNCEGPNADKLRNIILLRKKCREDFAKKKTERETPGRVVRKGSISQRKSRRKIFKFKWKKNKRNGGIERIQCTDIL